MTWGRFLAQINLAFGRRSKRAAPRSRLRRVGAQEDETILSGGLLEAMAAIGSSTWIRQD